MKKEIQYPAEITFKSMFTADPALFSLVANVLADQSVSARVSHRYSKNTTFISFTITAVFESEEHLNRVCGSLSAISGFIMMI